MSLKIHIYNPSPYPRAGYVSIPWMPVYQELGIAPERLILINQSGEPIPFQIDQVDPDDPSRDALVFDVTRPVPPGAEDYQSSSSFVIAEGGAFAGRNESATHLEIIKSGGKESVVALVNERLRLWLNLLPQPGNEARAPQAMWYAGAATSVQLDGEEVLDVLGSLLNWHGHDPEKRCMQIDQLLLSAPTQSADSVHKVNLFDRPYRLVSASHGPVRASVTIASESIHLPDTGTCPGRDGEYQLYRVINLYRGADFVLEELFLKKVPADGKAVSGTPDLRFAPNYFSYLAMGLEPHLYRRNDTTWFSVGLTWAPYIGYGFATDVQIESLRHPAPDFPDSERSLNTYSWQLQLSRAVRCLHVFMRFRPERQEFHVDLDFIKIVSTLEHMAGDNFEHQTGRAWYEHIYKPLMAWI